jgi:hypothetical protein
MSWFLRVALVGVVIGLAIPVATARASTTVEKNIPFDATIEGCGERRSRCPGRCSGSLPNNNWLAEGSC